jgi:hypothetical protein
MDAARVAQVRADMERAELRRLQPHYVEGFFLEAFRRLGGTVRERESRRYEIRHVPAPVRNRDRQLGVGAPVMDRYERVVFEKGLIQPLGQARATFICPGHPLLDAVLDLTLERHRELLRRGAVLVDERDHGTAPRVLVMLEHAMQDGTILPNGEHRTISRRLLYVELDATGQARPLQYAPYLDYRPLAPDEPPPETVLARPECAFISGALEMQALGYAISTLVPDHAQEVTARRTEWVERTRRAVRARLTQEIVNWDNRAEALRLREQAGQAGARLNSQEARKRTGELEARLAKRMEELDREAQVITAPPVVLGGVVVIPAGLLRAVAGQVAPLADNPDGAQGATPADTQASAARARAAVIAAEQALGFTPVDREFERLGYDIESRDPATGRLRFLEVKGRVAGADTITVTRNEILYSLAKPEEFILALVEFRGDGTEQVRYLRAPFRREPDFGVTSVNYHFADLLGRAGPPS